MKKKIAKTTIVASLALAMALGGTTGALAKGNDNGKGNGWGNGKGNSKIEVKLDFKDVDMDWARKHIASLAAQKIFEGYSDGTFQPNKPVSRLEALVTAVRLMGLRDAAESDAKKSIDLNLKDEKEIADWATGYVAVALENDLFFENEDKLQPNKPADRLWITTVLVKALDMEDEAKAKMNTKLSFKDAKSIPAGSVGYVAVAVEKEIVKGYTNNTFQPNKPVTRAEIAAFLDRAGAQLPDSGALRGTLKSVVTNNVLTLSNGVQYTVDPGAFVYRNNTKIAISDLKAGETIQFRTYNNVVIFIEVVQPAGNDDGNNQTITVNGTLLVPVSGSDVYLVLSNNTTAKYKLASTTTITRNGVSVQASALQAGDKIVATVQGDELKSIVATSTDAQVTQISGTLTAPAANNKISLLVNGSVQEYSLAQNVTIKRNGETVALAALQTGDAITARISSQLVISVEATGQNVTANFSGILSAAVTNNILSVYKENQLVQYAIKADADIFRSNVKVTASALKAGDEVFVRVENNQVELINVNKRAEESTLVNGSITAISVENSLLLINKDNVDTGYLMNANTKIYRGNTLVAANQLKVGDAVFVKIENNFITYVQVTEKAEDREFTITGLFNGLTMSAEGKIATISILQTINGANQTTVYNVAPTVTITGNATLLVQNHPIELKGKNNVITQIVIK